MKFIFEVDRKATVWFRDRYSIDTDCEESARKLLESEIGNILPEYPEITADNIDFIDATMLSDTVEFITEPENDNMPVIEINSVLALTSSI